jgi:hypothetical protein
MFALRMKQISFKNPNLWLLIAFIHLFIVTLGAFSFNPGALSYYFQASGAGADYSFFSKGVGDQIRIIFDVTGSKGEHKIVQLEKGHNRETAIRIENLFDKLDRDTSDKVNFRRVYLASLAGSVFGQNPDARDVTVKIESYSVVTMDEYRQGSRGRWVEVYSGKFEQKAKEKLL